MNKLCMLTPQYYTVCFRQLLFLIFIDDLFINANIKVLYETFMSISINIVFYSIRQCLIVSAILQ